MLSNSTMTKDQARRLIEECFSDLKDPADHGFVPESTRPDLEIAEQREVSRDLIQRRLQQIENQTYPADVRVRAMVLARQAGFNFIDQSAPIQHDLMEGVARADIEQARFQLFRLNDRLSPYEAFDPLFTHSVSAIVAPTAIEPIKTGLTLGQLVEAYLNFGTSHWVAKTVASRTRQLRLLEQFLGHGTSVRSITTDTARSYRDALMTIRVKHSSAPGLTFQQKVTSDPSKQISPKTALLIFESAKCLFRWAKAEGHMATNPAEDLKVKLPPAKAKVQNERKPFSADDLKAIFSSPLYGGCASKQLRTTPGDKRFFDAKFWVPLIGLFSGLRLSEIIQLHFGDMKLDGPIPYFDICEDGGGSLGSGDAKHVKSKAGIRRVPIHPALMQLGFDRFVRQRAKQMKAKGRLFFEVAYGADGMPSTAFSKWFGRYRKQVGITDGDKVFHSFRHTAKDALRETQAASYVIDQLMGHAEVATASYGQGNSLQTLYDTVCKLKFPVDVLTLVKPMP